MGSFGLAALDAIEGFAQSSPNSLALMEPDGFELNYKEFLVKIEAISYRLHEAGIGVGQRVAILFPQGGLHVLTAIGVLKRYPVILLSPRATPEEVEATLRKLDAAALIAPPEFEAEAAVATRLGLAVLVARKEESPEEWQIRLPAVSSNTPFACSEPGVFLFSSGTTGASKIVFWSVANINAGIQSRQRSNQLTSSDRLLLMITICNGAGIINVLTQFAAGGAIIATSGFDAGGYVGWLNKLKPTWYVCAPIVHQACLSQLKREVIDRPVSLRFLETAGAALPQEARQGLEEILGVPVLNVYGANEVQYIARETVASRGPLPDPNRAGISCGLEIRIRDSSGRFLPPGQEGEIVVRGATVSSGYVGDPELSLAAFQDGWFRTGDRGRLSTDGNLYLSGRYKEIINRGGEKIVPSEVDMVLASHPAVLEAAAFALPHPTLGEDVACAVVLRTHIEAPVSGLELRRYAAGQLAPHKVPRRIEFVSQIPRSELGKPQRWMLADALSKKPDIRRPSPAEVTRLTKADSILVNLHEMWQRILNNDNLGFTEDFFEAGGDSLSAINMLAEVDERFGSKTSAAATSFLDEPTLANLARLVDHGSQLVREESSNIQVFPVRTGTSDSHLFCIPDNGVEGLYYRRLAKYLSGKMDLSVARPANTIYRTSLFSFECMGKDMADAIRRVQPHGPYFLSGYCFGGIVAIEAARQLSVDGQQVRIILFDTPLPRSPGFFSDWREWIDGARRQLYRLWTADHPGISRNLRRLTVRLAWSALIPFRSRLVSIKCPPAVQLILQWGQFDDFPIYRARSIESPVLHFLAEDDSAVNDTSEDQSRRFDPASRFAWRRFARRGVVEQFVAFDHYNVFHESNLPVISSTLLRWCEDAV